MSFNDLGRTAALLLDLPRDLVGSMDGSPPLVFHNGFTHLKDAQAFKARHQAALTPNDCICLAFERPCGVKPLKGRA